jgi:hypothetical protein
MAEGGHLSIKQEIEKAGIEQRHFDTVYARLKQEKQLPPRDVVPEPQYTKIVDYLRGKHVLGENNELREKDLRFFEIRITLESMPGIGTGFGRPSARPSGGIAPCRYESESSGGIAPCRYDD